MDIDKVSRKVQAPRLIKLSEAELEAFLAATDHYLKAFTRFIDGALSVWYKVAIEEVPDIQYAVQLRHHGNVTSMNLLMSLISSIVDPSILPLPAVYPIPGEEQRQKTPGFGRQIARLIPGPIANSLYPHMSHQEKLVFVQNMALAFQAIWHIHSLILASSANFAPPKLAIISSLASVQTGITISEAL